MKSMVVHEMLERTVHIAGNKEIVSGNTKITYNQFYERVIKLANSLQALGIKKGTVVGVLDVNTHRYLELHYSLSMLGAIIHTINFRLPADDLVYTMLHAEDEWVFVSEMFLPSVKPLAQKFPKWVIMADKDAKLNIENAPEQYHYEELIQNGKVEIPSEASSVHEDDIYSIFYTTGTTGKPKGIRYTHRKILSGALQLFHHLGLHRTGASIDSSHTIMPLIPFFHIHAWGTAFAAPYLGLKIVLPGKATPEEQVKLIKEEKVNWLNMVPTQLHMLLELPEFGNVKVLTGGSALPTGLAKKAWDAGIRFSLIYGGSDQLATSIAVIPDDMKVDSPEAMNWLRSRMLPLPMVRIAIKTPEGKELPRDGKSIGEIWVASPWLPGEYYKAPEQSRDTYIDGWFKTGDLGSMDPDGFLIVADREKDAVKSGGEWIMTSVLEALLSEHPKVAIAAVIAREDDRWGERPVALIKPSGSLEKEELRAFMERKVTEGKIAKFWIPDDFIFIEDMPITSAGKINKVELRKTWGVKS